MIKQTWFTADTHFNHKNVIGYCNRPFTSIEHMNEGLIGAWNEVVSQDDTVYHLGDFGFGSDNKLKAIRERLNGNIILILGNHDLSNSKEKWITKIGMNEVEKTNRKLIYFSDLGPINLNVSHYPYKGDHTEVDRYKDFRMKDDNNWILHGHVHGEWRIKNKQFNVGVDVNNYAPVSILTILKEILK